MTTRRRALGAALTVAVLLAAVGCGGDDDDAAAGQSSATAPVGVLEITAGECAGDAPTGSWFRMIQPGGDVAAGPYVDNGDSPCADPSVTVLAPGTDGGLRVGDYQPEPNPPFDENGASTSAAVIAPVTFFAVPFGISTNPTDPQSGTDTPAPTIALVGEAVEANLSSLSVAWNGQHFNQGAPKPGAEGGATGTYDDATDHYTLDWTSVIEGGPFDGFTGVWHLEGTFRAS